MQLSRVRQLVADSLERDLFENAVFWADKAISLSNGAAQDIYSRAHALFLSGDYRRAAYCLQSRGLVEAFPSCRYLVAKCHAECKEWQLVVDTLDVPEKTIIGSSREMDGGESPCLGSSDNILSAICLLRGKACQAVENRAYAAENFKQALRHDVFCYEAFSRLVSYNLLTVEDLKKLVTSLPMKEQCSDEEEADALTFLYMSQINEFLSPESFEVPSGLEKSLDVTVLEAQRHYFAWDPQSALAMTEKVLVADPYHPLCLLIHIGCLVTLEKSNDLFLLAHKLVEDLPEKALSWYAVGSYYLITGKRSLARQYFSKATGIDSQLGLFWLAFGHSFSVEGEHDQAIATYQTAIKHMPGCHLPLLFIGQEYIKLDTTVAEQFLKRALSLSTNDPDVFHELGVLHYQAGRFDEAQKYLMMAVEKVEKNTPEKIIANHWESLFNNCGHCHRKLEMYEEALFYHGQALKLVPGSPDTFTALGYVYSLMGQHGRAAEEYQKALVKRKKDTFATEMLEKAFESVVFVTLEGDELEDPFKADDCEGDDGTFAAHQSELTTTTISNASDMSFD
eukprot:m.239199 g.239199  ORF g.239199 m.239199 type:complete len:565 (+) comp40176_c1_seq40:85-1779(+)